MYPLGKARGAKTRAFEVLGEACLEVNLTISGRRQRFGFAADQDVAIWQDFGGCVVIWRGEAAQQLGIFRQ